LIPRQVSRVAGKYVNSIFTLSIQGGKMLLTEKSIKEVNLHALRQEARVTVIGYFYGVDLGYGVQPQHHRDGKDRKCTCGLGADCPAVQAVVDYLKAGGERAPDLSPGYFPVAPQACPICGEETYYVPGLSSKRRGAGWACVKGSESHYWQHHVNVLRGLFAANPWLFPPVVAEDGRVFYPGMRRDEVITEETLARE
jgi:hypothetical protein